MGYYSLWSVCCVILAWFVSVGICGTPRSPMAVPFGRNYVPTWAYDHIKYLNSGYDAQLLLDKYTGQYWVQSKGSYLFGHFSMDIKMVAGDSAGIVTVFY
ncbi:hypothetical protein HN51_035876, partial [Arachis hypogaea]